MPKMLIAVAWDEIKENRKQTVRRINAAERPATSPSCFFQAIAKNERRMALTEQLGFVEAERFITLVPREPFDYRQWQHDLYKRVFT